MTTPTSKGRGRRKYKSSAEAGKALGFRSGLEERVAAELERAIGNPVPYEAIVVHYDKPAKKARYTPDFQLPNGIIVETKGRFVTADRQKHLVIKAQRPDLDIRFVFSNPNTRISKQSKTTYAMWCEAKGFKYAKGSVPAAWIEEKAP
jgi:hypothetical protein